jgi:hypothetical protein
VTSSRVSEDANKLCLPIRQRDRDVSNLRTDIIQVQVLSQALQMDRIRLKASDVKSAPRHNDAMQPNIRSKIHDAFVPMSIAPVERENNQFVHSEEIQGVNVTHFEIRHADVSKRTEPLIEPPIAERRFYSRRSRRFPDAPHGIVGRMPVRHRRNHLEEIVENAHGAEAPV